MKRIRKKIPVSIITGFLGAGKTTLINNILKYNKGVKFAVIENEFGEIAIDSALVETSGANIFELVNGCVCCSMNDEFLETLSSLMESGVSFDHILLETTGVAEPDAVAASFNTDYFNAFFRFNGTICIADSEYIENILKEIKIAKRQIAFADLILLNKADMVSKDKITALKNNISGLNPFAGIEISEYCNFHGMDILKTGTNDVNRIADSLKNHSHESVDAYGIDSHSFEFDVDFDLDNLMYELDILLRKPGYKIYRIKGLLSAAAGDNKIILQSVGKTLTYTESEPWKQSEKRRTVLVFIGKLPGKDEINKILRSCLYRIEI